MAGDEKPFIIRNYRDSDLDEYASLRMDSERVKPHGYPGSARAAILNLKIPGAAPEDNVFIAETKGRAEGYLELVPEQAINRALLDCWVAPAYRGKGMASELFERALKRAGELGIKRFHIHVEEKSTGTRKALSRLGFHPVRRFLELRIDISRFSEHELQQAARTCRRMRRGEESRLVELQNRAFRGSWGYSPNTAEEILHRTGDINGSGDVFFACDGDAVDGYCWTGSFVEEPVEKTGKIFMLGVEPEARGKGVGKSVLLAGLACLKNKGMRYAQLTVDGENRAALALYRSLGFRQQAASIMYEKEIA